MLALALAFPGARSTCLAAGSGKLPVVPKWQRFEQAFRSSVVYTNPLQDVTLSAVFTSPLGEEFRVQGFWDGGRPGVCVSRRTNPGSGITR